MLLAVAILAAVVWPVVVLVLGCFAKSREVTEAHEELNDCITQLYRLAASERQTSGRSAQLTHRRSQPMREILQGLSDDRARRNRSEWSATSSVSTLSIAL